MSDFPSKTELAFAKDLSGSELQSILIGLFADRASKIKPSSVLESWSQDRFVRPSSFSPIDYLELDLQAFRAASGFQPIELSPVCPLGTNSAVAPVSQNKVLSTIRNTEVVADPTNVMALECAHLRKKLLRHDPKNSEEVKLCASHRTVRTQKFSGSASTAHFRLFSLVTAGRDTGNFKFESNAMAEHIAVYWRLFQTLKIGSSCLGIYGTERGHIEAVIAKIHDLVSSPPEINILGNRDSNYYPTVSFSWNLKTSTGHELNIGDGGITNWTEKLLSNSKERLMISGIGSDRIVSLVKG
jgi:hypothetical protein